MNQLTAHHFETLLMIDQVLAFGNGVHHRAGQGGDEPDGWSVVDDLVDHGLLEFRDGDAFITAFGWEMLDRD